jgi:hypothetical protein
MRGLQKEAESLFVQDLPELLRWSQEGGHAFRSVHDAYVEQLGLCVGRVLRRLRFDDPERASLISREQQDASDEAFLRVLTAPETSSRVLDPAKPIGQIADHLHRSFLAEAAREGRPISIIEEIWTALGDARIRPGAAICKCTSLDGRIALDFESPYTTDLDPMGSGRRTLSIPYEDRARTQSRLDAAFSGITQTSEHVASVVVRFLKVLVLRGGADKEAVFGSSSCQRYIGRAVILNPHLAAIDELHLAEAMVHEAIHSVLYTGVQTDPWGLVEVPLMVDPFLASPWTGKQLRLSAFLHACFVWYGLAQFWSLALRRNAFTSGRVAGHLARAVAGFCGPRVLMKESFQDLVQPAIRNAIEAMQSVVVSAHDL